MMIPSAMPMIMMRYIRISVVAKRLYFVQKESRSGVFII
jgi:hypothetical protein